MQQVTGDIWSFHPENSIVIPTNTTLNQVGELVMGAGLAKQAKHRFPLLPQLAGDEIKAMGGQARVLHFPDYRLILFPTKTDWRKNSSWQLIESMLYYLVHDVALLKLDKVYLPRLGCGLGGLQWEGVEILLNNYLDDRYTVVHPG
jgi:hypothetical protein